MVIISDATELEGKDNEKIELGAFGGGIYCKIVLKEVFYIPKMIFIIYTNLYLSISKNRCFVYP